MTPRILLVIEERELRDWLRHHLDILWPDATVTDMPPAQFESGLAELNLQAFDLIALSIRVSEALADPGDELDALRRLLVTRHCPAVIAIAEGGNELGAVEAMRIGVVDYLPRSLLNAQRVANSLRLGLRTPRRGKPAPPRAARPSRLSADPDTIDLPQYSLLHKLGESTRAAVYLAHSATLGRNVALKISKPIADAGNECQEFAREYSAISALHHPSVVDIYDYGFHDGREFIAMEYFPCGDLKMRLQQPMTVTESLEYAHRICAALEVVHGAGLVHRDLKPPNVMLREDGSVVLIDFGLAKHLDKAHLNTMVGVLRGSPYYMSPEQAQGLPLDPRSDIYSTGVILFEMLTGRRPYLGTTAVEVMQQHINGGRPTLPAACASLEPLLDRMMARDRDQRFANAAEVRVALNGAIALLTSSAGQPAASVTLQ
ncbi:MAG TPA: protein kinase [Steroidobacteraceae bacterium]|jgi:DNA-binding response OmpR family regulator